MNIQIAVRIDGMRVGPMLARGVRNIVPIVFDLLVDVPIFPFFPFCIIISIFFVLIVVIFIFLLSVVVVVVVIILAIIFIIGKSTQHLYYPEYV